MLSSANTTEDKSIAISKKLHHVIQEEKLVGATWSILDSNGQILTGAVGMKNLVTRVPMRPNDRIHVGSIAKTVLSLGILRLVTQKKLRLEDTVENILPRIRFQNPWHSTNPVTVRHLLDHRAGLEDTRLWQIFSEKVRPETPLEEAFTRDTTVLRVYAPPGTIFSYSNNGFTLLGMIIEAVSGIKYEAYLDSEILAPLGMLSSTTRFVSQMGANADSTLAMGHLENGELAPALPLFFRPAAQLTTTAYDIAVMMRFLMSNGYINGQEFIARNLMQQLGQQHETLATQNGLGTGYSLGVGKRDRNGVVALFHAGAIVGYNAMMQYFPEAKCGFFVAHNMDSETAKYERSNQVLLSFLPVEKRSTKPIVQNSQSMAEYEGYYTRIFSKYSVFALLDELTTITLIRFEQNQAILEPIPGAPKYLAYLGKGLFQMQDRTQASHVFYRNENGDYLFTDSNTTNKKTSLLRLVGLWVSLLAGILGLVVVLCLGLFQLLKSPSDFLKHPILPSFGAISFFVVPILLFLQTPYAQWGDITAASLSLYGATAMIPAGSTASLLRLWQVKADYKNKMGQFFIPFFALLCILQMAAMLGSWGVMPLALWR